MASQSDEIPKHDRRGRWLTALAIAVVAALGGFGLTYVAGEQLPSNDPGAYELPDGVSSPETSFWLAPRRRSSILHPAWWLAPRDENAFLRLPAVMADLAWIGFHPHGVHGLIIGRDGTRLVTQHGGKSWVEEPAEPPSGHGPWMTIRAGGVQWTPANAPLIPANPEDDLCAASVLPDGRDGWAVSSSGKVYATRNKGSEWTVQVLPTTRAMRAVHALDDGTRVWVVGESGSIFVKQAGDDTWKPQPSNTARDLLGVAFAWDGRRGVAVGDGGFIATTSDGGSTWVEKRSNTSRRLHAVAFANRDRSIWVAGDRGTLLASTDGGATWTHRTNPVPAFPAAVSVSDDGMHGWLVGEQGALFESRDGGDTWALRYLGTAADFQAVDFTGDGRRGWIASNTGIVRTTDGGEAWSLPIGGANFATSKTLAIRFAPGGLRGCAVGALGLVVWTRDGGVSWSESNATRYAATLRAIDLADDGQRGWAVGDHGTFATTNDGCATWTAQSLSLERLNSVQFSDSGDHGWVVGEGGASRRIDT